MIIIRDTREKKEYFTFSSFADVSVIQKKVDVGDYTIRGHENRITVDRKRNTGELQINFGQQSARFQKEFERMACMERAYFVCAFPYSDLDIFPVNSGIPKKTWKYLRVNGRFLKRKIHEIEEQYKNISFVFCDDAISAEQVTYKIFQEYLECQHS